MFFVDRWFGVYVVCCVFLGGYEVSSFRRRFFFLGGRWVRVEGGRCCFGFLFRLYFWEELVVWGLRFRFLTVY